MSAISTNPEPDTTKSGLPLVVHQLYVGVSLIVIGAVVGLIALTMSDSAAAAAIGSTVIAAGAALLPTGSRQ
jgi:hypothetical protein